MIGFANTYETTNGDTIDVKRRGNKVDLHMKNKAGRTVATVVMGVSAARANLSALKKVQTA